MQIVTLPYVSPDISAISQGGIKLPLLPQFITGSSALYDLSALQSLAESASSTKPSILSQVIESLREALHSAINLETLSLTTRSATQLSSNQLYSLSALPEITSRYESLYHNLGKADLFSQFATFPVVESVLSKVGDLRAVILEPRIDDSAAARGASQSNQTPANLLQPVVVEGSKQTESRYVERQKIKQDQNRYEMEDDKRNNKRDKTGSPGFLATLKQIVAKLFGK